MASFTEQAALKLTDDTTANANRINTALTRLFATASKLKSVDVRINGLAAVAGQLKEATSAANAYAAAIRKAGASIAPKRTPTTARELPPFIAGKPAPQGRQKGIAAPAIDMGRVGSLRQLTSAIQSYSAVARQVPAAPRIVAPNINQGRVASLNSLTAAIRSYSQAASAIPSAASGIAAPRAASPGRSSGVPNIPLPGPGGRVPRNNMFTGSAADGNWESAGRIMARSFVAVAGAGIANVVRDALSTAARGVVNIDTARAVAKSSGADVERLEASSFRAARATTGVAASEIMSSSTEQAATLQTMFKAGQINQAQFDASLDALTKRVSETAQILGTARGDFRRGAEDAREIEKAIVLTRAGNDTVKQQEFAAAMLRANIASGGDVRGGEMKRMLQQVGSSIAAGLSPEGVARLALMRDEGGKQSTAEIRMGINDLTRGSLNALDTARQISLGLRNKEGRTTITKEEFEDPVKIATDRLAPLIKAAGVDPSDIGKVQDYLDNVVGFTTTGARFFARAISAAEQHKTDFDKFRATKPEELLVPTIASQTAEISSATQDAAGSLTKSITGFINRTIGGANSIINSLGQGELPSFDAVKAAAPGAGIVAAGGAGTVAASALASRAFLPLNGSAVALNGSAAALDGAAAALSRAAIAQGGPGVAGAPGTPQGASPARAARGGLWTTVAMIGSALAINEIEKTIRPAATDLFSGLLERFGPAAPTPTAASEERRKAVESGDTVQLAKNAYDSVISYFRTVPNKFKESGSPAGDGSTLAASQALSVEMKALQGALLDRTEAQRSIVDLEKEIADNKAKERLDGSSDILNQPLKAKVAEQQQRVSAADNDIAAGQAKTGITDEMLARMSETLTAGGTSINTNLVTGAESLRMGLDSGLASGAQYVVNAGLGLGNAILSGSQSGASVIAEAIRGAVSNISVKATGSHPINTGATKMAD